MNYSLITERIINDIKDRSKIPSLFLHSCCAPCSSYTLEYLSQYFNITVFYFNPNISDKDEYEKRVIEQRRFIDAFKVKLPVKFLEGSYVVQDFYDFANNFEDEKEGGKRCYLCYKMRMEETARIASQKNFDFFATTLTISPLKNAHMINEIAKELEEKYQVAFLYTDLKKKEGYKRSIELSKEYGLYRQDYCGCVFSKRGEA